MIDEELRQFLLQFPGVVDEVGERISPAPLPQAETLPAITYQDITAVPTYTNDGESAHVRARYQINVFARKRQDARRVAEAVRCVLAGYRGVMGLRRIGGVFRLNSFINYEPETSLYQAHGDYELHIVK